MTKFSRRGRSSQENISAKKNSMKYHKYCVILIVHFNSWSRTENHRNALQDSTVPVILSAGELIKVDH